MGVLLGPFGIFLKARTKLTKMLELDIIDWIRLLPGSLRGVYFRGDTEFPATCHPNPLTRRRVLQLYGIIDLILQSSSAHGILKHQTANIQQ